MAVVVESRRRLDSGKNELINHLLKISIISWKDVSEIYNEFADMDPAEQMEIIAEIDKMEDNLDTLNEYHDGGELNKDQVMLYNILYGVISDNSHLIQEIKSISGIEGLLTIPMHEDGHNS